LDSSSPAVVDSLDSSSPAVVDSLDQDDDEDEVFFGKVTTKEKQGKHSKFNKRKTISMNEEDKRRSFEISNNASKRNKSKDFLRYRASRSSLYGAEHSIAEETDLEEKCIMEKNISQGDIEVRETSSKVLNGLANLSLQQCDISVKDDKITGRSSRNRTTSKSLISLPSVSTLEEIEKQLTLEEDTQQKIFEDNEDLLEEIIDVDNDQLFDDSLYSLDDDLERRLSTISNKINDKWSKSFTKENKKREKLKNKRQKEGASSSLSGNELTFRLDEFINSTERSCYYSSAGSLPPSRNVTQNETTAAAFATANEGTTAGAFTTANEGAAGPTEFDTTAEEMALYEMFGEDYDEIVDKMPEDEKRKLKEQLNNRSEEDMLEMEKNLKIKFKSRASSLGSYISEFCRESAAEKEENENQDVTKDLDTSSCQDAAQGHVSVLDLNSTEFGRRTPEPVVHNIKPEIVPPFPHEPVFYNIKPQNVPSSPLRYNQDPTYLLPTTASLYKRSSPATSPSKPQKWINPGPSPSKHLPLAPVVRSLIPQRKALSAKNLLHLADPSPQSIASPIATYLRENKPPPMVQQVKALDTDTTLESTMISFEDQENEAPAFTPCPLPEARYYAPGLAKEHLVDATNKDYNISQAFGQTNTLAKVTRHIDRVKVAGIKWNDDLVSTESLMSTPSHRKLGPAGKSVLKTTKRDSGLFDASMVDMSVIETVTVQRIGRGRGRGKGRGRGRGKAK